MSDTGGESDFLLGYWAILGGHGFLGLSCLNTGYRV